MIRFDTVLLLHHHPPVFPTGAAQPTRPAVDKSKRLLSESARLPLRSTTAIPLCHVRLIIGGTIFWSHVRSVCLPTAFIPPCLPIKAPQPPSGDIWLHEIKHDAPHAGT
jgi:hypothetical protein